MALELQTAYPIILGTYALFSFYYEGDAGTFFTLFGITRALAAVSIVIACVKTFPLLRPVEAWIAGERDEQGDRRGRAAAVWRMIRSVAVLPVVTVVIPSSILSVALLGLLVARLLPVHRGRDGRRRLRRRSSTT